MKLSGEVLKGVEGVRGIKALIVLTVTAFDLTVVPGSKGPDLFVPNPMFGQALLKQRKVRYGIRFEAFRELRTVVCLNTFDRHRKGFQEVFEKHGRGVCVVLVKGFYIPPAGVLINGRVLIELLSLCFPYKTGKRDVFHIDLYPLSGVLHLLIGLRDVFGVRWLDSHHPLPSEDTVKTSNGAFITTLHEFYPKDDQTRMRVSAAHICD